MKHGTLFFYFLLVFGSLLLTRCHKEKFTTDSSSVLDFSRDTVFFDTVFTSIGSTTQYLVVKNNHSESIRISDIILENGSGSQYRINVDGINGPAHHDVEILPNDSMYIFVEVTIDPSDQTLPFIVEDYIRFVTNGTTQRVLLQAFGQDAYFHGGLNSCLNPISETLALNATWDNLKPHVVYGIVMVPPNVTLTINPGVQVYFHSKSGIFVNGGKIDVQGELNGEVVFQGDRLEAEYADAPGQWGIQLDCPIETGVGPSIASIIRGGIWIYQSPESTIDYAIIKNGNMGIQVDTTGVPYNGSLFSVEIKNTKILNMAGFGLWGQGGSIAGKNLLVANCGQCCAYLSLGGKYQMDNCTFANYWEDNSRTSPAFALNNYYEDVYQNIQVRELIDCDFNNCIMFGNNAFLTDFNEFVVDVNDSDTNDYVFRKCLVDTDQSVEDGQHFTGMANNQGPYFCDPSTLDFRVNSLEARMTGDITNANYLQTDIDGNPWLPQLMKGCYIFHENCQ